MIFCVILYIFWLKSTQKVVLELKNWFQPANGLRSTRSLVEIHNICNATFAATRAEMNAEINTFSSDFSAISRAAVLSTTTWRYSAACQTTTVAQPKPASSQLNLLKHQELTTLKICAYQVSYMNTFKRPLSHISTSIWVLHTSFAGWSMLFQHFLTFLPVL